MYVFDVVVFCCLDMSDNIDGEDHMEYGLVLG